MTEAENLRELARYMAAQWTLGNRETIVKALFNSCPRMLAPLLTLEMASALVKADREEDTVQFMMECRRKADEWDRKAYCTTAWVELEDRFADYQNDRNSHPGDDQ